MAEAKLKSTPVARAREADTPRESLVVRFGPDRPLKLDSGIELSPFQIAYKTYGQLNAPRSNAVLICHALTGDQHVASVHPVTGKNGWWETMVGPGKPIDTERYFVICSNVVGGCMGSSGPRLDRSENRPALRPVLPGHHHPRHGARAGDADRSSRHRHAVRGRRRLDGRHAGAAMGGELSRSRVLRAADRLRHPAFGAEHRVPRSRPAGGDGRSGMAAWPLPDRGYRSASRARGRAHGRAHHLSCRTPRCIASSDEDSRIAAIRPSPSMPISRSRAICAIRARPSSSASTPIPISISPARWIISISRPSMTACWPMPSSIRRRASASCPSPATGCFRPRNRARSCMR